MNNKQQTNEIIAAVLRSYVSKTMSYHGLMYLDSNNEYQSALIDMNKEAELLSPTVFNEECIE